MMCSLIRTHFRFVSLMLALCVQGAVATPATYPEGKTFKPGYCNVCRDAPNNDVEWRNLANPSESFQIDGETWTCQYLQDTVQDVNPYNGAAGEARFCSLAQIFAEEHCTCTGPEIPSIASEVQNPNPACNLCQGQQFDYVPPVNAGITADTGVAGNMNCQGLYEAMAQGVLSSTLCPIVVANAGPVCCSLDSIPVVGNPVGSPVSPPTKPPCIEATNVCSTNNDCCDGLECRIRTWNGPKYCSTPPNSRPRKRLAGKNVGGAAGRFRASNIGV